MANRGSSEFRGISNAINSGRRRYVSAFRESRRAETRQKILDCAGRLLRKRGAKALTFEQLANEANVGLRTVFRHFPSREVLLHAVFEDRAAPATPIPTLVSLLAHCCESNEAMGELAKGAALSDDLLSELRRLLGAEAPVALAQTLAVLLSPTTWHLLRGTHALSLERASDCLGWAVQQLTGEIPIAPPSQPVIDHEEEEFID